jgi:hypothetical protein
MANCNTLVGIKNITFTFYNCDTNVSIGPISHILSSEELPTIRTCDSKNTDLPGGYTKREQSSAMMKMKVIRDLRVPLAYYQGCAQLSIQVEFLNGLVYTGLDGGVTSDSESDSHEVEIDVTFDSIDELLPAGALAA